ncbi:MAG: hypothetical protein R6U32_05455, partial [Candidatus Woesearchaeota archaeon]
MEDKIPGDFRGFIYEPYNEQEVVSLFFRALPYLDIELCFEEVRTDFPDCVAFEKTSEGWKRLNIEFELLSQNFLIHKHDVDKCDMVICWKHNWQDCPLRVMELSKELENLDKKFILHDRPKYTPSIWNREKFLDHVKKEFPDLLEYHESVLKILDKENIYVTEGEGARYPTYNFKIPSGGNKAVAIIQADGKIWIDFSKMDEKEKRTLINKLKEKLKLEFESKKA